MSEINGSPDSEAQHDWSSNPDLLNPPETPVPKAVIPPQVRAAGGLGTTPRRDLDEKPFNWSNPNLLDPPNEPESNTKIPPAVRAAGGFKKE